MRKNPTRKPFRAMRVNRKSGNFRLFSPRGSIFDMLRLGLYIPIPKNMHPLAIHMLVDGIDHLFNRNSESIDAPIWLSISGLPPVYSHSFLCSPLIKFSIFYPVSGFYSSIYSMNPPPAQSPPSSFVAHYIAPPVRRCLSVYESKL